jgi:hypothetical protein
MGSPWRMTGSTAERLRSSRLIFGVIRLFWPEMNTLNLYSGRIVTTIAFVENEALDDVTIRRCDPFTSSIALEFTIESLKMEPANFANAVADLLE